MKLTTLALLPTAALAAAGDVVPRAGAPAIPNFTGLTAAIDNTTAAVTTCTSAISGVQFKQGGGTDFTPVDKACSPMLDGLEKAFTIVQQTVDPSTIESLNLATLQPLEQPLTKLLAEFEKLGTAVAGKAEAFITVEACPLLEKYGSQIEAQITKFVKDFSSAIPPEISNLVGGLSKDADKQVKEFTDAFAKAKAEYCGKKAGTAGPTPAPAPTPSKSSLAAAANNTAASVPSPKASIVRAAAAVFAPQASLAFVALIGAVILL